VTRTGPESWEDLARAANRGDNAAYERFLRAITPVLRSVVRAKGGHLGPEHCEDILQDVLLAIHLKRHTWHEDAPIRPWLYAIARHKVVDAFRARGTRVNVPIDDFLEVLPATDAPDPLEARDMDRVLDQLDPRMADLLRGFGQRGESTTDLAQRLQMSEGAVRVALHRALKSLAKLRERMVE
jgi:RNA polymerase sigma factor (sigma-70 family)